MTINQMITENFITELQHAMRDDALAAVIELLRRNSVETQWQGGRVRAFQMPALHLEAQGGAEATKRIEG